MKIIHFHFGKDGGAERFFVNLANAFSKRGIEQKFVIRPDRIWRDEISHCGEIIENHYRYSSLSQFWLQWKVGKMIKEFKPDGILSWMPRASRLIPKHPNTIKITRLGDYPQNLKHFGNCDGLVTNTPDLSEHCKALGWEKHIEVITNFPGKITPIPVLRSSLDTPQDAFVIAGVGRFVSRKGMDTLIRAASKLDNAWLWLIGDGKEKDNLISIAKQVGMNDRLRFTGWQKQPEHFFTSCDMFCMPSRHEPLGNALLEAWNIPLPVVASRSQGPSWLIRNEENGLLVDIDDVEGFAQAFQNIRDNPKLRNKIIVGGTATLEKKFSEKAIVDQYLNLFSGKIGNIIQ